MSVGLLSKFNCTSISVFGDHILTRNELKYQINIKVTARSNSVRTYCSLGLLNLKCFLNAFSLTK